MYRYNTDKRVAHSAGLLFDAIEALMKEKKFDAIGIKEVSERAGVGRATFYRNFNYVEDVLRYRMDQCFEQMREQLDYPDKFNQDEPLRQLLIYWSSQQGNFLQLLLNAGHWQLFQDRFLAAIEHQVELGNTPFFDPLNEAQRQYVKAIIITQVSTVLQTWVERGRAETPEQLSALIELPYQLYVIREKQAGRLG